MFTLGEEETPQFETMGELVAYVLDKGMCPSEDVRYSGDYVGQVSDFMSY